MASAPSLVVQLPGYPFRNLSSVATIGELRALSSATRVDGDLYAAGAGEDGGAIFGWDASSLAPDNGTTVIKPNDRTPLQVGRWLVSGKPLFDAGQAASDANAAALTGKASTSLSNIAASDMVVAGVDPATAVPIGNPYAPTKTKMAATLYGDDPRLANGRGFTAMYGVDNRGQAGSDNLDDFVAGYFGAVASPYTTGAADTVRKPIWAINTVTLLKSGSGTLNSRGVEFDFVNSSRNIGAGDGPAYLNEVIAAGAQVYHSGPFSSTSAFLADVGSDGSVGWYRGFTVAPKAAVQAGFADYSNSAYAFDVRGSHAYGLHIVGTTSYNVVNGPLTVGSTANSEGGVTLDVYGFAKFRNGVDVRGTALNLFDGFGVRLDGTLKSVTLGAADSAGTGYKVLRVSN